VAFKSLVKRKVVAGAQSIVRLFGAELTVGPLTYNQDGLATKHNCDFLTMPRFKEAYLHGKNTGSWGASEIQYRAYIACWVAQRASGLAGDFVECGVNRGGLARTVMAYTNFKSLNKTYFLLDTFQGLAEQYVNTTEKQRGLNPWGYTECYDAVVETFSEFQNVAIIQGTVPDTLPQVTAPKVAYLLLDMNCTLPEIAAAEYFWPKMAPGALILLDDYAYDGYSEQKHAFDRFAADRGIEVLALPTGQGLISKPCCP